MKTNQMTYRQAMAELTGIVNRLRDSENVDVDELVMDVARAKELIDFCGGKIKKADTAIKGIVSELQTEREMTVAVAAECHASSDGNGAGIPF
jgi:exodeoxyribonuclease VII small subunit